MRMRRAALAAVVITTGVVVAPPAAATGPTVDMPASAMADEDITIRITDLPPGETVTITAEMTDDFATPRLWRSQASFVADDQGRIDLRHDEPLPGGSYSDDDRMGLFYSMRLVGEDNRTEFGFTKFTEAPSAYTFTFAADGQTFATRQFQQVYAAPGVTRTEIDTAGVKGFLHLPAQAPPANEPYPALIAITGSDGGKGLMLDARSALLASHGYVVLNLPYFNFPGLPALLENIPLEYFGNAIDWLQTHPWVDPERIGVTGASRGGEGSLLIASEFDDVKAVVASSPIGVVWTGAGVTEAGTPSAAWTLDGQPLDFVDTSASAADFAAILAANQGTDNLVSLTDWTNDALDVAPNLGDVEIPLEQNADCEYLLLMGADDELWPSERLSRIAERRMEDAGLESNITVHSFADAGHILLLPNQPTTYDHYFIPAPYGVFFALGGTPEGSHHANRMAWEETLVFLDSNL